MGLIVSRFQMGTPRLSKAKQLSQSPDTKAYSVSPTPCWLSGQRHLYSSPPAICPYRETSLGSSQKSLEKCTWATDRWNSVSVLSERCILWGFFPRSNKEIQRALSGRGRRTADQVGQPGPSGSQTWRDCSVLHRLQLAPYITSANCRSISGLCSQSQIHSKLEMIPGR